jgi:hypothetical protein
MGCNLSGKMSFNALESAVLQEIAKRDAEFGPTLSKQLATANSVFTENTGAGCYTRFDVDRTSAVPLSCKGPLGQIWVEIQGFADPMTFLLWTKDGYADCLEGATSSDTTVGFDFDAAKFRIIPIESV